MWRCVAMFLGVPKERNAVTLMGRGIRVERRCTVHRGQSVTTHKTWLVHNAAVATSPIIYYDLLSTPVCRTVALVALRSVMTPVCGDRLWGRLKCFTTMRSEDFPQEERKSQLHRGWSFSKLCIFIMCIYSYCYVCSVLGILSHFVVLCTVFVQNVYCTTATGCQPNCS